MWVCRTQNSFPTSTFGEKGDYSNFNISSWPPRTNISHREVANCYLQSNTRSQQYELEREYGIRCSMLLELPYFDAPGMCIVNPMHNLLLGTAKHMIELWKSLNSPKQYDEVQERVDSRVCSSDIGRVPSKIASSFCGFTAEQLKNWTLFFLYFHEKEICLNSITNAGKNLLMHATFLKSRCMMGTLFLRRFAILIWCRMLYNEYVPSFAHF